MKKITGYHGTDKIIEILNENCIKSLCLQYGGKSEKGDIMYDHFYSAYVKITQTLAKNLKNAIKDKKITNSFILQEFRDAKNDVELADLAYTFESELEMLNIMSSDRDYKELKRKIFVFLDRRYESADMYKNGKNGVIFEFEIPEDIIRINSKSTHLLVKKKVDLKYLKTLYVDKKNIKIIKNILKEKGLNANVKEFK